MNDENNKREIEYVRERVASEKFLSLHKFFASSLESSLQGRPATNTNCNERSFVFRCNTKMQRNDDTSIPDQRIIVATDEEPSLKTARKVLPGKLPLVAVVLVLVNSMNCSRKDQKNQPVLIAAPKPAPKTTPAPAPKEFGVFLSEHVYYKGKKEDFKVSDDKCNSFPKSYLHDKVSSIDVRGHCVILWQDVDCKGESSQFKTDPKGDCAHDDFTQCNFNDKASAISECAFKH